MLVIYQCLRSPRRSPVLSLPEHCSSRTFSLYPSWEMFGTCSHHSTIRSLLAHHHLRLMDPGCSAFARPCAQDGQVRFRPSLRSMSVLADHALQLVSSNMVCDCCLRALSALLDGPQNCSAARRTVNNVEGKYGSARQPTVKWGHHPPLTLAR